MDKKKTKPAVSSILSAIQQKAAQVVVSQETNETATNSGNNESGGIVFLSDADSPLSNKDELKRVHPKDCYVVEQVRDSIDHEKVKDRRASMEQHGQIKPITVMPRDAKGYRIVTGEYRWRAASLEPVMMLDAIVKRTDTQIDKFKLTLKQIAENDENVPLTIYEMASSLKRAQEEGGLTSMADLARHMGWDRPEKPGYGSDKVGQYLKMYELDERGVELFRQNLITDIRSIPILVSLRSLSEKHYSHIVDLIEKGEKFSRKKLQDHLDLLRADMEGGKPDKNKPSNKGASKKAEKTTSAKGKAESVDNGGLEQDTDGGLTGPQGQVKIYFTYNRKTVELVYKEAPTGKVWCKLDGQDSSDQLLVDCEEVVFSHFKLT